jgi:SAM-dependent methyltransferase
VLDEYYGGYFHDDGPKITLGRINGFVNRLLRVTTVSSRATHLRLLDFGGGDGTLGLAVASRLLTEQPERSVDFTLVDYQAPAGAIKGQRLKVSHCRNLEQANGPFDLILASAVLEHIPNLKPVLERLFGLLAEGGWFYARTPYVAPLKRLMPKLDFTYPGHVHDLGAPFWNRAPETYGLPLRLRASRPSLVQTHLLRQPVRTVTAWLMKLPAQFELKLFSSPRTPFWRLVGGWEAILQMQSEECRVQNEECRTMPAGTVRKSQRGLASMWRVKPCAR